jgi:hypothetical protein
VNKRPKFAARARGLTLSKTDVLNGDPILREPASRSDMSAS